MTFDAVPNAPVDPILGLNDAFRADANPRKVNLSVGVYKDSSGKTPIMRCVKEIEGRILRNETTKDYVSIQGSQEYAQSVQELVFGRGSPALTEGRTVTAQTPGGTAALRVAADGVNALRSPDRAMVVITHYQRLLNYIVPDFVHVMSKGRVVKSGGKELALELEASGYAQFEDAA